MIVVIGKNSALVFLISLPSLGYSGTNCFEICVELCTSNFLHGLSLNSDLKVVFLRLFGSIEALLQKCDSSTQEAYRSIV